MEFDFQLSLRRIACTSLAASFWENELIENATMKELLCFENEIPFKEHKWYPFLREIIKKISPNSLPAVLYHQLLYTAKNMGLRICGWFQYLCESELFGETLKEVLFENYIKKKICWTHYGTIDEIKIFNCWLNDPNINKFKMYKMACCYCLEDQVENIWGEIIKLNDQFSRHQFNDIMDQMDLNIISYWDTVRNTSDSDTFKPTYFLIDGNLYDLHLSVEENMLRLCAGHGYHIGFKYFWSRLDSEEKKKNTSICLEIISNESLDSDPLLYNTDRYNEICKLLLQNLTDEEIKKFLTEKKEYYLLFINFTSSLPWQEFPILHHILPTLTNKDDYIYMFNMFINSIKSDVEFYLPVESSELHKSLCHLWQHVAPNYKLLVSMARTLMSNFFEIWDLSFIDFILNDKSISLHKEWLLEEGHKKLFQFIKNKETNKIEQFFCQLLVSEKFNDYNRDTLKKCYKDLLNLNLNSINSILNFLNSISDDVKHMLKNKLPTKYISYYLIKNKKFDLADEFLLWSLESTKEVNNFKNRLINDNFARNHVFETWNGSKNNLELMVSQSDYFLNWLTNSSIEDIHKFKNREFKGDDPYIFSRLLIREFRGLTIVDDFLAWCLWSDLEIQVFKNTLSRVSQDSQYDFILRQGGRCSEYCKYCAQ